MNIEQELAEWNEESQQIIEELLMDGSDPDAIYTIEHHLFSNDFDLLEKAAAAAFKLGFEVTDAEELELDDGEMIRCFDVIFEGALELEKIQKDVFMMLELADKYKLEYDGWGTYFEGDEEEGEEGELEQ